MVRNVSLLAAIGVGADGYRQIFGVAEGEEKNLEGWRDFLSYLNKLLKDWGLAGAQRIISGA